MQAELGFANQHHSPSTFATSVVRKLAANQEKAGICEKSKERGEKRIKKE